MASKNRMSIARRAEFSVSHVPHPMPAWFSPNLRNCCCRDLQETSTLLHAQVHTLCTRRQSRTMLQWFVGCCISELIQSRKTAQAGHEDHACSCSWSFLSELQPSHVTQGFDSRCGGHSYSRCAYATLGRTHPLSVLRRVPLFIMVQSREAACFCFRVLATYCETNLPFASHCLCVATPS